ncbi:M48 family metalloprotease [Streptomyces sp. G-G2]|uniref:M48 family metalloprotease n=1 Tax=Streptomyces sp. G-G2 TaxID=3046201 RepID=UPI0024BA33D4|nr:M48 family metalloprotease [Streptomyces sp. G-G2]MDJ0382510.1 M48 family metalloprotease [Streptomyces sp. G-G2]
MRYAVYLPLLFPLVAALAARPLGERLPPRLASWLLTFGAVVLAAASSLVLGMLAITGLIRFPLLARLANGRWSAQVAQDHDPASLSVGLLAGALLAAAVAAAAWMLCRRVRTLAAAAAEAACMPGRDQLVVVEDAAAEAYAIPGRPGRIVVSTGMLDALDPAEHEILLSHERAHLRHHHHLFVAFAQLASAANPLLRPLAATITYTVERWADESAATATGDRRRVARTVGKAALAARHTRARSRIPRAALGILGLGQAGPGPVPRRVAALMAPPPHNRVLPLALTAGLLLATGLCAAEAAHDLEALLEMAKHAASRG